MKKPLALLIAMVLLLAQGALAAVSPEGTFPIVSEPITLRVMVPNQSNVEDITTNDFTLYYEQLTGIHIEWIVVPEESRLEKVNISLSSGDLPDVYLACSITQTQQLVYGAQGAFVALNPYIEKYGSLFQEIMKRVPNCKEVLTMSDGNIYALPRIEQCPHCEGSNKMWVNRVWLETLGLNPPTTINEFYDMLVAFKTGDPNGNGIADEIPLLTYEGGWNSTPISGYLTNPFVYTATPGYLDNGNIVIPYLQEGWKEAMVWLNKLYKEGLYYDQSLVLNLDQAVQVAKSGADGVYVVGAFPNGVPSSVPGPSLSEWVDYVCIPALAGPAGQYATWGAYSSIDPTAFVMTSVCEYPDAAFRWGVEPYENDLTYRKSFGVEGINWGRVVPGQDGVPEDAVDIRTGTPAQVEVCSPRYDGIVWSDRQNFCWRHVGVRCDTGAFIENRYAQYIVGDYDTDMEYRLAYDTRDTMQPYYPPIDMIVPPLVYTEEQAMELANIEVVVTAYRDEMAARFITGDVDVEQEWDSYLTEMDAKGATRLRELYQAAYDAKYRQ
ncbi:MAG: extracellular solute-binding protein [Christensenellales bacterium]